MNHYNEDIIRLTFTQIYSAQSLKKKNEKANILPENPTKRITKNIKQKRKHKIVKMLTMSKAI